MKIMIRPRGSDLKYIEQFCYVLYFVFICNV